MSIAAPRSAREARRMLKRVLRWTEVTASDPELGRLLRRSMIRLGSASQSRALDVQHLEPGLRAGADL